jgi:RimJ/RimL family protein N-acetyltransferase
MSAPPTTELATTPEEEARIRGAVLVARVEGLGPGRRVATVDDVEAVLDLLADPAVSEPIYDLPRPLNSATVRAWIEAAEQDRQAGRGLLVLTGSQGNVVSGYSRITVWPERASAELAGALRAGFQGAGAGGAGAAHTIDWIFDALGVRLVCLTAATDNIRSIRLIDRMGFRRMGERTSVRPDGSTRTSCYWEMTATEWQALKARLRGNPDR